MKLNKLNERYPHLTMQPDASASIDDAVVHVGITTAEVRTQYINCNSYADPQQA